MEQLLAKASSDDYEVDDNIARELRVICSSTVWGFREIILVIGIAKLLDPTYAPTSRLYDCNPRAIFEGPIREVLRNKGIPHRKSGPLNIAKATAGLDEIWAAQRRPGEIALLTVEVASIIETSSESQVQNIVSALLHLLMQEAARVEALGIEVPKESDVNYLSNMCSKLIDAVPAGGNTPEYIIGLLLEEYHILIHSDVQVLGHTTGASTTSTTSKKPADIIEKTSEGEISAAYEVTMKPFDEQRIVDSEDAVLQYNKSEEFTVFEINVICREQDVHPKASLYSLNSFHLGTLIFGDISYQFYEIHCWIAAALGRLSPLSRVRFYQRLNEYIANPGTSEQVKQYWKEIHDNRG